MGRARFDQFDLQAADATANLEHGDPADSVAGERVEEPPGGPGQALAAVAARVSLGGLGTEDGAVAGGRAAVHVPGTWVAW